MGEKAPGGTLLSIQVGTPKTYGADNASDPRNRPLTTSFSRTPVTGPRQLFRTHLEGNAQADTQAHGSPNHAVLCYAASHYPYWQSALDRTDLTFGGFAENFTVEGLDERTVCLGDHYRIGEVEIEVTDPRFPCSKIERYWQVAGLTAHVRDSGRTGWYCSVLREGMVTAGLSIRLLERPFPEWTIARVNDVLHGRERNREKITALMACPLLNPWWVPLLSRRLAPESDPNRREDARVGSA